MKIHSHHIRRGFLAVICLGLASTGTVAHAQDTAPSTPTDLTARAYGPTSGGIRWARSTDDRGVRAYEVTIGDTLFFRGDALSFVSGDLSPGTSYPFVVVAIDTAGQRSGRAVVRLNTPDAPPEQVTGLRAAIYSSTAAGLAWDRAEAFGTRYEVKRDGVLVETTSGTSYIDHNLDNRRSYLFEIISINRQGQRARSARLFVNTAGDAVPPVSAGPAAPEGLRAIAYSATAGGIAWDRSMTFGIRYEVARNGIVVATTDGTSYIDSSLTGGQAFTYDVIAIDREGRRSAASQVVLSTPGGSDPTTPPTPDAPDMLAERFPEVLESLLGYQSDANALAVNSLAESAVASAIASRTLPDEQVVVDDVFQFAFDISGPAIVPTTIIVYDCELGGSLRTEQTRFNASQEDVGISVFGSITAYRFDACRLTGDDSGESVLQGTLETIEYGNSGGDQNIISLEREWQEFSLLAADGSGFEIDGRVDVSGNFFFGGAGFRSVALKTYVATASDGAVERVEDAMASVRTGSPSFFFMLSVSGAVTSEQTRNDRVLIETLIPLNIDYFFVPEENELFTGEILFTADDGRRLTVSAVTEDTGEALFVDTRFVAADGAESTEVDVPFDTYPVLAPGDQIGGDF